MRRSLFLALLFSALVHLLVLAAPGWDIGSLFSDDAPPLEARLIASLTKTKIPPPAAKPRAGKPMSESPAIPPADESVKPVAQESLAAADTRPPVPAAEDAKPADAAPVAEAAVLEVPEVVPPLPRSGRIRYAITRGAGGFIVGQSIHEWHHDGKRYSLSATSETTGIAAIFKPVKVVQTSEGGFLKGELKPEVFRFDRGGNDVATANFDWKAQQVTLGDGQVIPITDGAEDFLSMYYQLVQAAQRGEGFVMAVATGKKVERYAFEWLGEEEITLKLGTFHAWHVRIHAATGGKDITEIWLARELASLPVKIRFTDRKGDVSEQVAEDIHYEGK